ncbi:hypothetical protein PG989_007746 [Apiospora arundinis]
MLLRGDHGACLPKLWRHTLQYLSRLRPLERDHDQQHIVSYQEHIDNLNEVADHTSQPFDVATEHYLQCEIGGKLTAILKVLILQVYGRLKPFNVSSVFDVLRLAKLRRRLVIHLYRSSPAELAGRRLAKKNLMRRRNWRPGSSRPLTTGWTALRLDGQRRACSARWPGACEVVDGLVDFPYFSEEYAVSKIAAHCDFVHSRMADGAGEEGQETVGKPTHAVTMMIYGLYQLVFEFLLNQHVHPGPQHDLLEIEAFRDNTDVAHGAGIHGRATMVSSGCIAI